MNSSILRNFIFLVCCYALPCSSNTVIADNALQQLIGMQRASLLLDSNDPSLRISHQPDIPRIPASTLKILTAWLAIRHWGLEHRFHTDFYLDEEQKLWIKGYGDPMLVSEEIEHIAQTLATSGVHTVKGIYTDSSYFQTQIPVDGRSDSDNPYDAPLAALAANFNTIHVLIDSRGVRSAEPQTPLTATAKQLAIKLKTGKHRINIGSSKLSSRYFSELLQYKLRQHGVLVEGSIQSATIPIALPLYYRHQNSRTLEIILRSMLRYSTNFTANQLFLMLGAEHLGQPATMQKARSTAMNIIDSTFSWAGFKLHEGAGLSRHNRINSTQMIELLRAFQPWRHLLHSDSPNIQAKTGTLNGISSYAGYLDKAGSITPFALFIEQKVAFDFRLQAAKEMLDRLSLPFTLR